MLEGLGIALLALLLFAWIANEMRAGDTVRFDNAVRHAVHAWASPGLTWIMRGISLIGAPGCLFLLGIILIAGWLREGRKRLALLFGITMAGAEVLEQTLKLLFRRTRPVPFFGLAPPIGYSFPSGHALVSCCYFGVLAAVFAARTPSRRRRIAYWTAAAALSGAIGLSRIYLGVHHASDVIAGYAGAIVWVFTIRFADRKLRRTGPGV